MAAAAERNGSADMKIWVDMSAPAHVLVLRPIIERLRERATRSR